MEIRQIREDNSLSFAQTARGKQCRPAVTSLWCIYAPVYSRLQNVRKLKLVDNENDVRTKSYYSILFVGVVEYRLLVTDAES